MPLRGPTLCCSRKRLITLHKCVSRQLDPSEGENACRRRGGVAELRCFSKGQRIKREEIQDSCVYMYKVKGRVAAT